MKTRTNIAGALAAALVVAALIGMVEQEAVGAASAELIERNGNAIDACDEAFGQGWRIKPSLAEVGSDKFQRSPALVKVDGETLVVILEGNSRNLGKRCRVDPRTFQVIEKTEAAR